MMASFPTTLLAAIPTLFISGLALWFSRWYYWERRDRKSSLPVAQESDCKVLFFPDKATARSLSSPVHGSEDSVEGGSLSVLISTLQEAAKSIDVCVFTISCKELCDVLINAHHGDVVVRVITDKEQSFVSGSQVERLRRAGIQVRTDDSSYFMHHKFAVIDNQTLISGSLNWTLQGLCGNQENVMITASPNTVAPFSRQFELLWDMYDPEKLLHL